ncbi:hypothetical protein DM02DRAFT_655499 [Periconia macrospinosa]|uniref:Uncharacterized protein n=1 Tax=Periconia macrospinosa TaxID=97972 RepID=A0A2V1DSV6_9PLEO|nr:hypothetical protein DM02DRAFT_655499 [Periconia macrospinosa]
MDAGAARAHTMLCPERASRIGYLHFCGTIYTNVAFVAEDSNGSMQVMGVRASELPADKETVISRSGECSYNNGNRSRTGTTPITTANTTTAITNNSTAAAGQRAIDGVRLATSLSSTGETKPWRVPTKDW